MCSREHHFLIFVLPCVDICAPTNINTRELKFVRQTWRVAVDEGRFKGTLRSAAALVYFSHEMAFSKRHVITYS
jgi:hypothetical protein